LEKKGNGVRGRSSSSSSFRVQDSSFAYEENGKPGDDDDEGDDLCGALGTSATSAL